MFPKYISRMRLKIQLCFMCYCFTASFLLGSLWLCDAVSVNMQGSLTLGKEVMDMLTHYVGGDLLVMGGRRSMPVPDSDFYTLKTKQMELCENLQFCSANKLKDFVDEYVTMLGKAVESIFDVVTHGHQGIQEADTIFGAEFEKALKLIHPVLKAANNKITDDNEQHVWTSVIKKISSKLQNKVRLFTFHNLEGRTEDIINVRKKLDQKLILAIIAVEDTYLRKLCSIHGICLKHVECTRSLNSLLENFKKIDEKTTKQFIKAFQSELEETDFYGNLREETVNEFQVVLSDMANTDTVQAKEVLASVQKSVETRLKLNNTVQTIAGGFDTKLVNTILSDMDYIYSKHKPDPFHAFLSGFYDWQVSGSNIRSILRIVMKRIENDIKSVSEDIRYKLSNEVRIFLEITVDP